MAWSPDGQFLAASSVDRAVRVWPSAGGEAKWTFKRAGQCTMVAWSADGKQLAVGTTADSAPILDASTGREVHRLRSDESFQFVIAWHPRRPIMATAGLGSERIVLWDVAKAEPIDTLLGHTGPVRALAWSVDGLRLASGACDAIRIWEVGDTPVHRRAAVMADHVNSVAWSPDGRHLAVAGGQDARTVTIIAADTRQVLRSFPAPHGAGVVAWEPGGAYLAVASPEAGAGAGILNVTTGNELQSVPFPTKLARLLCWSADARYLALGATTEVLVWDACEKRSVLTWKPGPRIEVRFLGWPAEGEEILAGCTDRLVNLAIGGQARTVFAVGKQLAIQQESMASIANRSGALSRDSQRMVYGVSETGYVCQTSTGEVLSRLRGHKNYVLASDWSPDGRRLLTVDGGGALRIWDPLSGQELLRLGEEGHLLIGAQWSPDGRRIAAWTKEGRLFLWDAGAGYEAADPVAYRLEQSTRLLVGGRSSEALGLLEAAVAKRPRNFGWRLTLTRAHLRYGLDLQNIGNPEAAIEQLNAAIGQSELLAHQVSGSAAEISSSDRAWAYCLRAENRRRLRQYDPAIDDYTRAIELAPQSAMRYYDRAACYHSAGRYAEAAADSSEAIRIDPSFERAWHSRAMAYEKQANLDEAIADWTEAIRLDPASAARYCDRATCYRNAGLNAEAIADCSEAIRIDPSFERAWHSRAMAYENQGRLDLALADYSERLSLLPGDVHAIQERALVLMRLGKPEQAIADLDEAIRLDSRNARSCWYRAHCRHQMSELEPALADYTRAIDLSPETTPPFRGRAMVLTELGRHSEAAADLAKARQLAAGSDPGIKNDLAWFLATCKHESLRDPRAAVQLAEAAVSARPRSMTYWNTLAAARYRAGDWNGAVEAAQKSCSRPAGGDALDWFFLSTVRL